MRLVRLAYWLYPRLRRIADSRPPDFVIGDDYCRRWWVIPRNRFFNLYLHQFLHSDDDRALHDHPWINLSFLLHGTYREHTQGESTLTHNEEVRQYWFGALRFRMAHTPHRVELLEFGTPKVPAECWSLFVTGPVIREWGFHCPQGWRRWQDFVDKRDKGQIGRGCD